mmetsp:Transcript_19652/g.45718  ORF Transcript_19652/g.45718 Transcript_19652/m.45718 type:complete len:120 (-) Transcript_19652:1372-1731(-)
MPLLEMKAVNTIGENQRRTYSYSDLSCELSYPNSTACQLRRSGSTRRPCNRCDYGLSTLSKARPPFPFFSLAASVVAIQVDDRKKLLQRGAVCHPQVISCFDAFIGVASGCFTFWHPPS